MSTNPSPVLSAFAFLPDRDWNREWEAACSISGSGRGGRDPRVTIALGHQFRAFAGAVAGAVVRANLQPRVDWALLAPLKAMLSEDDDDSQRSAGAEKRKEEGGRPGGGRLREPIPVCMDT